MKRFIIFQILFAMISMSIYSQCKYTKNEKDEFNGNQVVITKRVNLVRAFMSGVWVHGRKNNDYKFFEIYYVDFQISSFLKDSKIQFLMEDGSVITGAFSESGISKYDFNSKLYYITIFVNFPQDQYKTLAKVPVKKIRLYSTSGYIEKNITDCTKFMEMVKCIL